MDIQVRSLLFSIKARLMMSRIVAIVVAFCFFLIFFCVPETFWDRTPHARGRSSKRTRSRSPGKHHRYQLSSRQSHGRRAEHTGPDHDQTEPPTPLSPSSMVEVPRRPAKAHRVGFADDSVLDTPTIKQFHDHSTDETNRQDYFYMGSNEKAGQTSRPNNASVETNSHDVEKEASGYPDGYIASPGATSHHSDTDQASEQLPIHYTDFYRSAPRKSYVQSLKPYHGRLTKDRWIKVMIRPFILFAYPAVLWSSLVYALAVGWLIILSESVAHIYQDRKSYNFTALQVGLVYISPFVGGVLGTAVAGKFSDIIVRFMARKNDGVYEPEFRLVMAIPITISTVIGLMGFGWSAEERDNWIVPTVFFGVISFGCSLASTTAVTFVVDSYRQYAGEALVTLNVSKSELGFACIDLMLTSIRHSPWFRFLALLPALA
jgi:hypothetical protein